MLTVAADVEWHDFDRDCTSTMFTFIHNPETSPILGKIVLRRWYEFILFNDHYSGEATLFVTHLAQTI